MLLFNVIPDRRRSFVFLNALIEVSARIPDIVCIAQTTLVIVNNALLVNDRLLLFFWFDLVSDLTACIHGANVNSNFAA